MQATPSINLPQPLSVWPEGQRPRARPDDAGFPNLHYYLPSEEHRTGQSVLILPGGGYGGLSSAKEGHRPAQLLCAHGIAAAVLEYRHSPQRHPVPLLDAQRGLRLCRHLARTHGLNEHHVGVMGFSAGAHLAGTLAMHPDLTEGHIGDELDSVSSQPDFQILIYPVVSFEKAYSHFGSRDNLLGKPADPDLAQTLSLENLAHKYAPPAFLVHAQNDTSVPPANSHALTQSLTNHQVQVELHIIPEGGHGFGLAANHPWGCWLLDWLAQNTSAN